MEKVNTLWRTLVAIPVVKRSVAVLIGLLLGLGLEQVARLGVLPPDVVQALRHALSVL